MALITLPVGNVLVPWIGPATPLAGQPWFTSVNVGAVYRVSANRLSYISSSPGDAFPSFTQVIPTASGAAPDAYIFVVKASFQLDSALIGTPVATPNPVRLIASFPAGGTSPAPITLLPSGDQAGMYNLDANNVAVGVSGVTYTINGTAATLPFLLAAGNVLIITATTVAGTPGSVTLLKQ